MGGTSGINRRIAEAFAARGGRMAVASGAVIPVDGGWALGGFSALGAALSELAGRAGR
jgi:hypothetical protein